MKGMLNTSTLNSKKTLRGKRRGGRGSSKNREDKTFPDFYEPEKGKYNIDAMNKSEAYLGFENGGDTDKWLESLTQDETRGVNVYTGSAYDAMNKYIRTGNALNSEIEKFTKDMQSALDKSVLTKNITVHRGDSGKVLGVKGMSQADMYDKLSNMIGTEFSFENFVSASPTRPWSGEVQYHIKVPKGKGNGAYVKRYSQHQPENEFIINTHKMLRIDKVVKNNNFTNEGYVDLYLTLIS